MGMTVRLSDGRVTVTVEGIEEAKRMQDGQAVPLAATEPPVADLRGPDLLLVAQIVEGIKRRSKTMGDFTNFVDCETIQKELTK